MPVISQSAPRYHGLKVSREEYLDLADDGFKYDMVNGVLQMTPGANFEHGRSQGRFHYLLLSYLEKHPVGEASLETDVLLPDGGDVLRPDISFILNENLSIVKNHIHGAPDLVAEILSESTRERDTGPKAERYLKNGVREYWLIDPAVPGAATALQCFKNRNDHWHKESGQSIESELLPGFTVNKVRILK